MSKDRSEEGRISYQTQIGTYSKTGIGHLHNSRQKSVSFTNEI
jgi:hypothetical protein